MSYVDRIILLMRELGIDYEINRDRELDLRECLVDSMEFINFIVALEEEFGFEFPDELLGYDNNLTIDVIAEAISDISSHQNRE